MEATWSSYTGGRYALDTVKGAGLDGTADTVRPLFDGELALVTGAGRGIGRASALELAAAGARVALLARSAKELDQVAGTVRDRGGTAGVFPADVADPVQVDGAVTRIAAELGRVSILISNAARVWPLGGRARCLVRGRRAGLRPPPQPICPRRRAPLAPARPGLTRGVTLAETTTPVLVFETGLPTRYYFDRTDVAFAHLVPTGTQTACPYKGVTSGYWSVRTGDTVRDGHQKTGGAVCATCSASPSRAPSGTPRTSPTHRWPHSPRRKTTPLPTALLRAWPDKGNPGYDERQAREGASGSAGRTESTSITG